MSPKTPRLAGWWFTPVEEESTMTGTTPPLHAVASQDHNDADGALFSASVRAGDFVFVSGQAAVDETGALVPGSFAEQMDRALGNVARILADEGLSLSDVVRVGAYLHDPADLAEYNRLYPQYFAPPRPARTTIAGCLSEPVKFEIDVVAYGRPAGSDRER